MDDRSDRIEQLLAEFREKLQTGKAISLESIVARHDDLMPELGEKLQQQQRVHAARQRARQRLSDHPTQDFAVDDTRQASDAGLHIRCPHCHNPIDLVMDAPLHDILCAACGSNFSLVEESAVTRGRQPLKTLGHFELVERLGMGGFGAVWKARDTELDRTVAVKVPRKGQLSSEEMEKFVREARTAAQLRHPKIVSVHEIGRSDDTVYIVCDLIRGISLSTWMEYRQPTARETAAICATIAEALHHAHEQGVIHRDLKPQNVMVDEYDQPHVMDFGLARREAGEITMTVAGQVLGTPAYMSPEQARGESHEADRRSDVYSLGVILFELLTGELPFRGSVQRLIQQVLHDEPPAARKLNGEVPRDLETICQKCMEKDCHHRYQTTQELADDLRCYERGEPIMAHPIGRAARLWRWCRRKPLVASLVFTAALALIIVACVSTVAALVVSRQKRASQEYFEMSFNAVNAYLDEVTDQPALTSRGMETLRRDLLEHASTFYRDFVRQDPQDARLRASQGVAFIRLGNIHDTLGETEHAEEAYRSAILIHQRLRSEQPQVSDHMQHLGEAQQNLGNVFGKTGRLEAAERELRAALQIFELLALNRQEDSQRQLNVASALADLGQLMILRGQHEGAQGTLLKSVELLRGIVDDPDDGSFYRRQLAGGLDTISNLYLRMGELKLAQDGYMEAIALYEQSPDIRNDPNRAVQFAGICGNLAITHSMLRQFDEAERAFIKAAEINETVALAHPQVPDFQHRVATGYRALATLYLSTRQFPKAEDAFVRARDIALDLSEEYPEEFEFRHTLATSSDYLGVVYVLTNQNTAARHALDVAIDVYRELESSHDVLEIKVSLAGCYLNKGTLLVSGGDFEKAIEAFQESIELREELVRNHPEIESYQSDLATSYTTLGATLGKLERFDEAFNALDRADEAHSQLITRQPDSPLYLVGLARNQVETAMVLADAGRLGEAAFDMSRGVANYRQLIDRYPGDREYQRFLAEALSKEGDLQLKLRHPQEAAAVFGEALEIFTVSSDPASIHDVVQQTQTGVKLIHIFLAQKDPARAVEWAERAAAWLTAALERHPDSDQLRSMLQTVNETMSNMSDEGI